MSKINIDNLSVKELEELQSEVKVKLRKNQMVNIKVSIDRQQRYVGKCYKRQMDDYTQYIMVVSALSSNEYHLDCLVFENKLMYERKIHESMHFTCQDVFQPIEYDGIRIEDLPLLCSSTLLMKKDNKIIDEYTEITKEEFYKEMDKYTLLLKDALDKNQFNDLSTAKHYMKYYQ